MLTQDSFKPCYRNDGQVGTLHSRSMISILTVLVLNGSGIVLSAVHPRLSVFSGEEKSETSFDVWKNDV